MNRNFTSPFVNEKLEADLASAPLYTVSARWVDAEKRERKLANARLRYVPYLVGDNEGQSVWVPLSSVTTVDLDQEKSYDKREEWPPYATVCVEEHLLVASWRRASWGELVRFRPE